MPELITGADGQLGKELVKLYPEAIAVDHPELDISDEQAVKNFDWQNIEVIFNAAAYTAVDAAETPEGKVTAFKANVDGVANLAAIARARDLTLLHVSTDYVFDGTKSGPYTEADPVNPQNVYGQTKAKGEQPALALPKHYLVRTSWVIGDGNNFVRTMLKLGADKDELSIVNDQIGRPTFASDLALAMQHLYEKRVPYGIYNFSNSGQPVSWADLAKTIFELAKLDCQVKEIPTAEFSKGKDPWAARPANSVFDLAKIEATGFKVRDWEGALADYIKEELS